MGPRYSALHLDLVGDRGRLDLAAEQCRVVAGVGDERRDHHLAAFRDLAEPEVAQPVEERSETAGEQPQHEDQPDAAAGEAEEELVLDGDDALEPLGRLDEDRAEDRARHGAEPADHDHREDADALDGSEDRLAERLLVEREQSAGEGREEPGDREGEELDACRGELERLGVPLVLAHGHDVAHRRGSARGPGSPSRIRNSPAMHTK